MTDNHYKINGLELPRFPLLGAIDNGELFEYLLISIQEDCAEIALLEWFVNRFHLHKGDKVDLFLPQVLTKVYFPENNISGIVFSKKYSSDIGGTIYYIPFTCEKKKQKKMKQLDVDMSKGNSLLELLLYFLKDSMILKSGIRVYFKHLISYFSRISNYSNGEYAKLETYFLQDIEIHIIDNENKLQNLYKLAQNQQKQEEIPIFLDLEFLRETIETEIATSVLSIIFSEKTTNVKELLLQDKPDIGIFMYINAIKVLERRLYYNYNNIVMIYLKTLV